MKIRVTVDAERSADDDDHSNGSGGSSASTGKNETDRNERKRQITVEAGTDGSLTESIEITRTTAKNGKKVDEVVLDKK
ncbi:hypothetical protein ABEO98_10350 [Brevibacillus parabrevis]|uniref:hypothetical protein n=1 Tax=Brevibacillus parabrevis TaxID=54914 RepID=UPI002E243EBA|nr:hypothetical protein [Brevibacillus parabrevis]